MSITFRVTSTDDLHPLEPTPVSIRELVAFRSFARANHILFEDLGDDEDISPTLDFEVSIGRVALAVLARIFGQDENVIVIMEEAQFTQRQIRFYRDNPTGEAMLKIANTIDGSVNLDLALGNAYAMLEALDVPPKSVGEIPLTKLRDQLADPRIRAGFQARHVDQYLPRLDTLAAITVHQAEPQLTWS